MVRREVKVVARFLRKTGSQPAFESVADPRDRRGRRWPLPAVLRALFVSMAAMCRSMLEIEQLTEGLGCCSNWVGIERRLPDSTAGDILEALDPEDFRPLRAQQVRSFHRSKSFGAPMVPIALASLDGKNVSTLDFEANEFCQKQPETTGRPHWNLHALRAVLVSSSARPCIGQRFIVGKTNEMGTTTQFVRELLEDYGRSDLFEAFLGDAGFTSRKNAAFIDKRHRGYILALKENQPELHREAVAHLGSGTQAPFEPEALTPWEHYQGKTIRRELFRTFALEAWDGWPSLRQVWRVRQTTRKASGETVIEDRYFITNLVKGRLAPEDILRVVRLHWGIENNCFHTLDTQWKEDRKRGFRRSDNALLVLSEIRLLAYNVNQVLRTRHLRSPKNRELPWAVLRDWMHLALKATDPSDWYPDQVEAAEAALAAA
jgi:predicted transposase YbfD/YdcC